MIRSIRSAAVPALAAILISAGACASGPSPDVSIWFGDGTPTGEFTFESQRIHVDRMPEVKAIPKGLGPSRKMLSAVPGDRTLAWLYHFEDDGSALLDKDIAYTLAVVMKEPRTGTFALPSDEVSLVFFCDNWGGQFRACHAVASRGSVTVEQADRRRIRGRFAASMEGRTEEADGTQKPISLYMEGKFDAGP